MRAVVDAVQRRAALPQHVDQRAVHALQSLLAEPPPGHHGLVGRDDERPPGLPELDERLGDAWKQAELVGAPQVMRVGHEDPVAVQKHRPATAHGRRPGAGPRLPAARHRAKRAAPWAARPAPAIEGGAVRDGLNGRRDGAGRPLAEMASPAASRDGRRLSQAGFALPVGTPRRGPPWRYGGMRQWRKWRMPVVTMAMPAASAVAMTSASRRAPPGCMIAVTPDAIATSTAY